MTDQPSDAVLVARDGPVTILTINNPARRNALSPAVRDALPGALEAALADKACRAIVLTGAGEHFCAGGDIAAMEDVAGLPGRDRMAAAHRVVRLIVQGETPIIAAVEGHATGAGLSLAAACDIVVASRSAKFTSPFNRVGLVPDMGATWLLPLRMGLGRAKLMMMTGRTIDAETAERYGLAEMVVAAGAARTEAISLAREIAARAPRSNGFAKALLGRMPRDLDEMLRAEADAQGLLYASRDFEEGRLAFLEKRDPRFEGR